MPDYTVGDIVQTVRLIRPDLISDTEDARQSALRLVINGFREFPGLVDRASFEGVRKAFARPVISGQYSDVLTWLPCEIWHMRPDLKALYDLDTEQGQLGYLWWFFQCGVAEYQLSAFLTPEQDAFLFGSVDDVASGQDEHTSLPRLAHYLWSKRPDLQKNFDLTEPDAVRRLVSWFYQFAFTDKRLCALLTAKRRRALLAPVSIDGVSVPCLSYLLWQGAPALQSRYASVRSDGFYEWAHGEARSSSPLFVYLENVGLSALNHAWPYEVVPRLERRKGVNLVGYAQGESGVGEDVRSAAKALRAVGVAFSIVNIDPGEAMCRSDDTALSDYYDTSLPYDTTLFCTTAIAMLTLVAKYGEVLFDNDKVIGYWPWELSQWPQEWQHAFRFVDEVWASSSYIFHCLIKVATVPVRLAPMVVSVSESAGLSRRDFSLKQGVYYFIFSFDFLSRTARKNPFAVVEAFKKAFVRGDLSVGLVLKSMRMSHSSADWTALKAMAEQDSRIVLDEATLNRASILDLYRACNCFISLHRAEGFGRSIAESMLLGKPVIATAYSGNLDFTGPGCCGLVDYQLVPVSDDEYPGGEGQDWADPDVEQAVTWMRQLVNDPSVSQAMGVAGFQSVSAGYAPEVVGRRYVQLLNFEG